MGDRPTERSVLRPLGIDVDELMVLGDVGELVDPVLGHLEPLADALVRADVGLEQLERSLSSLAHDADLRSASVCSPQLPGQALQLLLADGHVPVGRLTGVVVRELHGAARVADRLGEAQRRRHRSATEDLLAGAEEQRVHPEAQPVDEARPEQ